MRQVQSPRRVWRRRRRVRVRRDMEGAGTVPSPLPPRLPPSHRGSIRPFTGSFIWSIRPFTGSFVWSIRPFTGAFIWSIRPFTGSFVWSIRPFTGAFIWSIRPFTGAFVWSIRPFTGAFVWSICPFNEKSRHGYAAAALKKYSRLCFKGRLSPPHSHLVYWYTTLTRRFQGAPLTTTFTWCAGTQP